MTNSVPAIALLVAFGLVVLGATPAAAGTPSSARPASIGVSLAAQPLAGAAPLVVQFRATVSPTALSSTYSWNFGDGATYQETATSYSSVSHQYTTIGTYLAEVFVVSSAGDANASVLVEAQASSLSAVIEATPMSGPAPLTVHFVASLTGGTGTYTAILWRFGDGGNGSGPDLEYTYDSPGQFTAVLNVTDSFGVTATTTIGISVASGTVGNSDSAPPTAAELALPLALVLAGAAGVAVAYRSWVARRPTEPMEAPTHPSEGPPATPSPGDGVGAEEATSAPATPESMAETSTGRGAREDSRRLSERLLVHLYWYGRSASEGIAGPDSSQAGMARRLGTAQNSISKSLARLIDAGLVRAELRHVPGAPRRLKTYTLTPRGEAIARTIRADSANRPPPPG